MRTQDEIKKMIEQLRVSGTDPAAVQQRTLFHKLEWKDAVKWIHPSKRTQEYRQRFEEMNKLDEQSLTRELYERLDQLFMFLADGDLNKLYLHFQMILVYLWLMRKDDLFQWLYNCLCNGNWSPRYMGRHLAEEVGISWRTLELRYP